MAKQRNAMAAAATVLLSVAAATLPIAATEDPVPAWAAVEALGGEATVLSFGGAAFSTTLSGLSGEQRERAGQGSALFSRRWSEGAPAVLGPRFVAEGCEACHRRDGKGAAPREAGAAAGLGGAIVFLAGDVGFDRVRPFAAPGVAPDPAVGLHWRTVASRAAGAAGATLRRPVVRLARLPTSAGAPVAAPSLRAAPATFGLGLLEAIADADIVDGARACRDCRLGIRGRVALARDPASGKATVGRFGWKGSHATIAAVSAEALQRDLGIEPPGRADSEITQAELDRLVFYLQTLGVPARRPGSAARRGASVFRASHCDACHRPQWTTGSEHPVAALRNQTIYPFTDLLLHDMGPDLAAPHPAGAAGAREWRTAPLWGLGLNRDVSGREDYLHDGRAGSIEEAILWHGGEARISRDAYLRLDPDGRRDLLAFLRSL